MQYCATPQNHGLGWLPDLPDQRDRIFKPSPKLKVLPPVPKVDLRAQCPAVYDQGQLGSCTANALAAAFDFERARQGKPFMTPSRLFIYWNERFAEGTINIDAGAYIRDGIKSLGQFGVPPETDWPYFITKFTKKPPASAYADAEKSQALKYERIITPHDDPIRDMLLCLGQGLPFVTGISVYQSFENAHSTATGDIPLPKPSEELLGGHAVLVVGFDRPKKHFICRNSWGADWGDKGYFYLPFDYLTNKGLASDMWVIQMVEV